ncbi:hypothetical protein [Nostocoides jenkinsii]|uniref:Uncharacterized protein n=1 Tax=Nostocoides jenkinsii Ben 74 TaxID=1193518 RepID=A0A077MF36_9MICO|nr:hypothetical protein [Tetrasphaera jenkinsii]CCI54630.1 conserved exported hypothetical protein [Tetrasphaera jenkinsii Ben 74]
MARSPGLAAVLLSAARLQGLVPDAVLVGGTAAAVHAGHRLSLDHDHVLCDLAERYAEVVEAVEASEGWVTSLRASSPPLTLLESLDGIEAGLRQLRRTRPLEVEDVELGAGVRVRVPTLSEMLRVKAYLIVQRNATRDYLDTAALVDRLGEEPAAAVLARIDDYYADRSNEEDSVLTSLVLRLAEPAPKDPKVTRQLRSYKELDRRWHDWASVVAVCTDVADRLLDLVEQEQR